MKCASCGAELDAGAKFCIECGTPVPQKKICPECGSELPLNAKFCFNCGKSFSASSPKSTGAESGFSMGDKNVVGGDLIGQKSETHISGGQTIINNTDETKKTNKCHVCGRIVTILEGYDCPKCGCFTCADCYDSEKGSCTECLRKESENKINAYKDALKEVYSDGIVTAEERKNLNALQKQLGISSEEAVRMESAFKKKDEKKFTTVEQMNFEEAEKLFYQQGKPQEALKLLEPIYDRHGESEQILDLYLEILSEADPTQAESIASGLSIDIENAYLIKLKNTLKNKNLNDAEILVDKVREFWGGSSRVQCYVVLFKIALASLYKKSTFLDEAYNIISQLKEPETTLESTWQFIAKNEYAKAAGKVEAYITKDFCSKNSLYFEFIRSNSLISSESAQKNVSKSDDKVYGVAICHRKTFVSVLENGNAKIVDSFDRGCSLDSSGLLNEDDLRQIFFNVQNRFVKKTGKKISECVVSAFSNDFSNSEFVCRLAQDFEITVKYQIDNTVAFALGKYFHANKSNKLNVEIISLTENFVEATNVNVSDKALDILSKGFSKTSDFVVPENKSVTDVFVFGDSNLLEKYADSIKGKFAQADFNESNLDFIAEGIAVQSGILNEELKKSIKFHDATVDSCYIKFGDEELLVIPKNQSMPASISKKLVFDNDGYRYVTNISDYTDSEVEKIRKDAKSNHKKFERNKYYKTSPKAFNTFYMALKTPFGKQIQIAEITKKLFDDYLKKEGKKVPSAGEQLPLLADFSVDANYQYRYEIDNDESEAVAVCPKCGEKLLDGAAFCLKCGTKVETEPEIKAKPEVRKETVCSACGEKLLEGAAFCLKCGTKVKTEPKAKAKPEVKKEAVCPKCGEKLLEGAAFCLKCGTKVKR